MRSSRLIRHWRSIASKNASPMTLLAVALLLVAALPDDGAAVTLISRSAGLQLPDKEEGRTEYEVGDINGDGHLDLVSVGDHGSPYVNSGQHGIMIWLGNGAGSWSLYQTGNFGYGGCALGDLNSDDHLDIAWGLHHDWGSGMGGRLISAAIGNGSGYGWTDWGVGLATGGESYGMFATALADFDGDGRLDIASQSFGGSNGIRVYENHGDGTWSQAWALIGGTVYYTIETCDVNADGFLDVVSTRSGSTVLLGDGSFGFTVHTAGLPAGTIRCIEAGDINNDGRQDLVFGFGSAGVRCYTYDPDGEQWTDASAGLPMSGSYDLAQFGDLNGDGLLDIVAFRDPTGYVYLGDGTGHWTADATWQMPSPGEASAMRVDGDIDHDGREDIVIQATMSGFPFYRNQLRVYSPWEEPASLAARVASPQGGEALEAGSVRFIRWRAAVPPAQGAATVDLELSLSGATGPWIPLATNLPNSGIYQWTVAAPANSEQCRIRVTANTATDQAIAISTADFRIAGVPFSGIDHDGDHDPRRDASEFAPLRVRVIPNPAREGICVQAALPHGLTAQVTLHDVSGRIIAGGSLSGARPTLTFPLRMPSGEPLTAGVYLVTLQTSHGMRTTRFVIM